MNSISFFYKVFRKIFLEVSSWGDLVFTWIHLKGNNVSFSSYVSRGVPYIMVARTGKMQIGENLMLNNGLKKNPIGYSQKCTFFVDTGATIKIGNNVGISQSALVSTCSIIIGDDVKIGGGCHLFTTDFHSLSYSKRKTDKDKQYRKDAPIVISNNVFIGAGSLIMKGVNIGENSIIGAGSIVTHDIPANQIWAGNPARFIRTIDL